jgi:hypothetical protein
MAAFAGNAIAAVFEGQLCMRGRAKFLRLFRMAGRAGFSAYKVIGLV